jgi:hypothetical protein
MLALMEEDDLAEARSALRISSTSSVLLLCTEGATDPDAYRRLTSDPGQL